MKVKDGTVATTWDRQVRQPRDVAEEEAMSFLRSTLIATVVLLAVAVPPAIAGIAARSFPWRGAYRARVEVT